MDDINPGTLQQLKKVVGSINSSAEYAQLTQSVIESQGSMLSILDRSLTIMQALHAAELKSSEIAVDVIKFLLPIFASAVIAGATVSLPNINSAMLVVIGTIGIVALVNWLIVTLLKRRSLVKKQNEQYAKLSGVMDEIRKLAELQQKIDRAPIDESIEAVKQLLEMRGKSDQGNMR